MGKKSRKKIFFDTYLTYPVVTDIQNGLRWEFEAQIVAALMVWAGTTSNRSGCPKTHHPAWS